LQPGEPEAGLGSFARQTLLNHRLHPVFLKGNAMTPICPMCGRPLKASGDCVACGGPKKENIGIIGSLAVTAITIAVIGMSVVGLNKLVGNPFYFQKAYDDIEVALSIDQNLLPAYMVLIGICNATADKEGEEETIRNALQLFPESFLVRSQYMHALQPRWGGSYRKMEYFAREAERYSDVNAHLPFLYGYIYCDQAKIFASKKQYKEAVKLCTKAMAYGDSWYFYEERASAYYQLLEPVS
jgi:hypothetical protein